MGTGKHGKAQPRPKRYRHHSIVPRGSLKVAAPAPQQPLAGATGADAPINVAPGRILSPVEEEEQAAAPTGATAAPVQNSLAAGVTADAGSVAVAAPAPAVEAQTAGHPQQGAQAHGMLQDSCMEDAPELQLGGPVAPIVLMPQCDDAAEGDGMSTSESDRGYGDVDADTGPPLLLQADASGGIARAGVGMEPEGAVEDEQLPHLSDEVLNEVCFQVQRSNTVHTAFVPVVACTWEPVC